MAIQASVTAVLGVTEPALFGVNVPLLRPMISACLAGAIGGAMVGAVGTVPHCGRSSPVRSVPCTGQCLQRLLPLNQ